MQQTPYIEVLPQSPHVDTDMESATRQPRSIPRLRLFMLTVGISCLIGWGFTFLRPAIYESTATILVTVPPDEKSKTVPDNPVERVALHSHVLTSQPLLKEILAQLKNEKAVPDSVTELREMLSVKPVDDSNIVELHAKGSQANFLPLLINTWIDSYLALRSKSQMTTTDSELAQQEQQRIALEKKISNKRLELDKFRRKNNIISLGQNENQVIARLKGMSDALNKANEDEVTAEANLSSIKQAIADNKPVVSKQEQRGLSALETRAVQLREQLRDLEEKYTPVYLQTDPTAQALKRNLKLVNDKINDKLSLTSRAALSEAEQALSSARQRVSTLKKQIANYKQVAEDFSTNFSEHEASKEELLQLEQLYRDVKARIVEIQVRNERNFPQVEVIERSTAPSRIWPHYMRDAGISLLIAIVLGLLMIWLLEFLYRPPLTSSSPPTLKQLFYAIVDPRSLPQSASTSARLEKSQILALEEDLPRELSEIEVRQLIASAEPSTAALIMLLLSGVSSEEAASLDWQDISFETGVLNLKGDNQRQITLSDHTIEAFRRLSNNEKHQGSIWFDTNNSHMPIHDLEAMISCASFDAGLANADEINSNSLRHTYLAFLARQGIRLSEFQHVCGPISPITLRHYGRYSPPGSGIALNENNSTYTALH